VKLNVDGSCNSRGGIVVGVLFGMIKVIGAGFFSNDGQGDVLFAKLFAIYHDITFLLQHGHSRAIIESYNLEVFNS